MHQGTRPKPVVLVIVDGWGYREEPESNAIAQAHTPVWDRMWTAYPHTLLNTSGASVGLPGGQMGNSEVGHLNLGAGRVVYQELTRVSRSIRTGYFFDNRTLTDAVDRTRSEDRAVHVFGLLSPGGVHSHEDHILAMLRLAVQRGAPRVFLHAFLDGRDTPPKSAESSLRRLQMLMAEIGGFRIAGIVGRYYAMDRDNHWSRIGQAYDMMALGQAPHTAEDPLSALKAAYARGESDEFVQPTLIRQKGTEPVCIQTGDSLVFMNFRADRARQLTQAFIDPNFTAFERLEWPCPGMFVSLTEYNKMFDIPVAFPPERLDNGLGEYLSKRGLTQLRLAETEKYAHVTFFFNGGVELPFEGEERILVPSPQVPTYDLQPEMSAEAVTDQLVGAIEGKKYDVIICNYANADMVGHTGNLDAAVRAVETLDRCFGRVLQAILDVGGEMLITADHGNVEQMFDPVHGQRHTAHTNNPVPLVYLGHSTRVLALKGGALSDVAPTLLAMMGLSQPHEMRGRSLFGDESAA
jgi:2,3-bisphosphoglycerate-independent phosphoglycerate mutase